MGSDNYYIREISWQDAGKCNVTDGTPILSVTENNSLYHLRQVTGNGAKSR